MPISLLPQFSKIVEKLIKNRLLEFNILSNCQYVSRKHTSTADNLAAVIESVTEHLEHLNKCAMLSIDLRKAFDTLDHDILMEKLYIYSIIGMVPQGYVGSNFVFIVYK